MLRLEDLQPNVSVIVEFYADSSHRVHYLRRPFRREPGFGVPSVNYSFADLIRRAELLR